MLIKIMLILVVLGMVCFLIIINRPSEFRYTRTSTMAAPPSVVFAQVNDFHKWQAWSPWAKMDPASKNVFEGPPLGTGSVFRWNGNHKVGAGIMTIMESRAPDFIRIKLEFLKPFSAVNTAEFTFMPQGNQTLVTWSMFGKSNFTSKTMGLFINFDTMVGSQFEEGLSAMKSIVERGSAASNS